MEFNIGDKVLTKDGLRGVVSSFSGRSEDLRWVRIDGRHGADSRQDYHVDDLTFIERGR